MSYLPYSYVVATVYISIELCFGIIFYYYIIPKANKLTEPARYRDYGDDKLRLMLRIMHRIEKMCHITKQDENVTMKNFLTEWFHPVVQQQQQKTTSNNNNSKQKNKNVKTIRTTSKTKRQQSKTITTTHTTPDITYTPSSSPDNSDDEHSGNGEESTTTSCNGNKDENHIQLYKEEMDDFFAWAFHGKFHSKLGGKELTELDRIYKELENRHELVFPSHDDAQRQAQHDNDDDRYYYKPRCMTLEPVNSMYRPLFVYLVTYGMKIMGGICLRLMGYHRLMASTGLVGWYRPGRNYNSEAKEGNNHLLPMLFFHGIAPGGFALYLPMIFFGLATEPDRPVFIFENRTISCAIDFHPLTEQQTVDGVVEILKKFDMDQKNLSLVGHSFGSCVVTWMIMSKRLPNIKHVALIDPVAILLSEPDVMVNFLYAEELDKIRMVASSELFTEYYLRRHFAWYNSELWLEDVDCPILIGLSENDEIINSQKVKQEIERHPSSAKLVFWENVGHGACIRSPTRWKEMKRLMLKEELKIVQQTHE
jgi:pimeloyl-ACP methyl ester carboxylesterase